MNNKKLAAFTLVEALIGVIIMMIVIGGIALSIKMGIDMYGRAEAHSELINGMRFTLDSFNREISPMLDVTREVEILSTDISNIPSVSDDNHYIYLENGSLTHRSKSGDKILTGSEYIDRVAFSYPTDTKETGENYTLRMNLTAKHERYGDTEYNTTLEKAMYNLPSKRGDNGNILRFKYSELEVIAEHLRIYNLPMDISNTIGNKKGITATASYDLVINPTPDRNYKDVSLIEWFISGSIKAPEEITEEIPTEDNSDIGYWRLMTEKNGSEPLTGIEIDTKKDFYSKDNNGTTWKAGVLKYRITPMLADDNGEIVLTGTPVWGPFADIVSNTDGLWDRWSDNLLKNITDDPNYITRNDGVDIYTYPTAGTKIVRINPNNTNNASSIYANVQLDLLKNEREFSRNSKGNNGTAFTTITNYSLIVDAKIYDGSGYGIFINGRIFDTKAKKIKDNGYVFQYDNDRHSFLIRLFGNSIQAAGDNTEIEELGSNSKVQGLYGAFPESVSLGNMDKRNETTEYTPRAMQNASFRVPESLNTYYHTRKRMLFTILEYYMYTNDDSGKKEPHYIIRMRTLKNANDVFNRKTLSEQQEIRKKDPWLIGKDFYDSEPIWFGDFVGETPIKQDGAYHLPIKNYSTYNGETLKPAVPSPDTFTSDRRMNRYILRLLDANKSTENKPVEGYDVVRGFDMNIRKDLLRKWPNDYNSKNNSLDDIFASASKRYVGVRVWANSTATEGVHFYEINFAPGFTAEELKAIMPNGGCLYQVKDTFNIGDWNTMDESDKDYLFSWDSTHDSNLNKILKNNVSDGIGNEGNKIGILDIQHTYPLSDCDCSICFFSK